MVKMIASKELTGEKRGYLLNSKNFKQIASPCLPNGYVRRTIYY